MIASPIGSFLQRVGHELVRLDIAQQPVLVLVDVPCVAAVAPSVRGDDNFVLVPRQILRPPAEGGV